MWDRALNVAESQDRIHLKTTHHHYAMHLEAIGDINGAVKHFELADTHRTEVPRMLFDLSQVSRGGQGRGQGIGRGQGRGRRVNPSPALLLPSDPPPSSLSTYPPDVPSLPPPQHAHPPSHLPNKHTLPPTSPTRAPSLPQVNRDPKVLGKLEEYIAHSSDPELIKWWAGYCESIGQYDKARHFYHRAQDVSREEGCQSVRA